MSDKQPCPLHRGGAFPRRKPSAQIEDWARPARGEPAGALELVGRTEKYQGKIGISRRYQREQRRPVAVSPILARNPATNTDRNEAVPFQRGQTLLGRRHFAGLQTQIPEIPIAQINRAERGQTARQTLRFVLGAAAHRVDAWLPQVAAKRGSNDMTNSA